MELTKRQEEGLNLAIQRHRDNEKYIVIGGYAGTGKTTLVKFIIDALDVSKDKVAYVSYTGKAAEVLRKKGNPNAMTLHRLLYDSFPRQGGGFIRVPKKYLGYTIIVVDEISMVRADLLDAVDSVMRRYRHSNLPFGGVQLLMIGDAHQLPPVVTEQDEPWLKKVYQSPFFFSLNLCRKEYYYIE